MQFLAAHSAKETSEFSRHQDVFLNHRSMVDTPEVVLHLIFEVYCTAEAAAYNKGSTLFSEAWLTYASMNVLIFAFLHSLQLACLGALYTATLLLL